MSLDNFDISNFQGNGRQEPTYIDSCINVSGPRWSAHGQGGCATRARATFVLG